MKLNLDTLKRKKPELMKEFVRFTGVFALAVFMSLAGCQGSGGKSDNKTGKNDKTAGRDNGVTLMIADADLIQVDSNPQYNTAEWSFTVKNPGSYDVWLSSLTCDTSHLNFNDIVTITAGDARIEKKPVGDEIVTNDKSVKQPWYRADSHMGSIFFREPGEYQIQVISDKVMPHPTDTSQLSIDKTTLINSLILKPLVN